MDKVEKLELTEEITQKEIDTSTQVAYEFVEEYIIPQLDEFDFESDDEEYMPGCATFVLFTRLVGKMATIGYSIEELKQLTEQYYDMNFNDTLH